MNGKGKLQKQYEYVYAHAFPPQYDYATLPDGRAWILAIKKCLSPDIIIIVNSSLKLIMSVLRRERARSLSAPASITFPAVGVKKLRLEKKAVVQLILESTTSHCQDRVYLTGNFKACAEVGKELKDLSGIIERELQGENRRLIEEVVRRILTAIIRNHDITWELLFEAIESLFTKELVDFTVFGIALVRRYKDELPNSLTNWVIDIVAGLMASAYERYHINEWIQEQGGWRGVLQLIRNKYQTFAEYVPVPRGLGSWRQTAVAAGGVLIGVITVGAGVWYFR